MPDQGLALVINTGQYSYHSMMAELFCEVLGKDGTCTVKVFDMKEYRQLHEAYQSMAEYCPRALISFDCVGFEMQTENDTLSYNLFTCRMAHILFQEKERYRAELKQQMNFSMFVYSMRSEDVDTIRERYVNIPNISFMDRLEYKQADETIKEENRKRIADWYEMFQKEAGLEF